MKHELQLVEKLNHLMGVGGGGVKTDWATSNIDEVCLMLNAATLTYLQTFLPLTTLDDLLSTTSNPASDAVTKCEFDREK